MENSSPVFNLHAASRRSALRAAARVAGVVLATALLSFAVARATVRHELAHVHYQVQPSTAMRFAPVSVPWSMRAPPPPPLPAGFVDAAPGTAPTGDPAECAKLTPLCKAEPSCSVCTACTAACSYVWFKQIPCHREEVLLKCPMV